MLDSLAAGHEALTTKKVDALLLLADNRLVFRANVDTKLAAIADTAVRAPRRHLPPAPELTTASLKPPSAKPTEATTLVAISAALLLLMSLAVYGQWVITGIVEEKNNRVVELLLSTVQPRHLLAGKVIGIGLLGLAQLALVAGLAAVLLAACAFHAPTRGGSPRGALVCARVRALRHPTPQRRTLLSTGQRGHRRHSRLPTRSWPPTSPAMSLSPLIQAASWRTC